MLFGPGRELRRCEIVRYQTMVEIDHHVDGVRCLFATSLRIEISWIWWNCFQHRQMYCFLLCLIRDGLEGVEEFQGGKGVQ